MDGQTHARTDNVKTVYPPQTKFAGGIVSILIFLQGIYHSNEERKSECCHEMVICINSHNSNVNLLPTE